jgi:hypothetical protein
MRAGKSPSKIRTKGNSRVTNGSALLPRDRGKVAHTDGRSSWMRRFRDLINTHTADLGGADALSEAERSIIRRCATLTVLLERLELDFALEDEASAPKIDQYQRVANTLKRLLESLGLKRRSKDITPDLSTYLKSRQPRTIDASRNDDDDADDEPEHDAPMHRTNGSLARVRS